LHPDPGAIEHPHIEAQRLAQAIENARILAREPHAVRPPLTIGHDEFLHKQAEVIAGSVIPDVTRPTHGAARAGLRLFLTNQCGPYRGRCAHNISKGAELVTAVAYELGKTRHQAWNKQLFS